MRLIYSYLIFIVAYNTGGVPQAAAQQQNPAAQITLTVDSLPGFRQVYVNTYSDVQFYDIDASGLSAPLLLEANYPLLVSLHCHDDFNNQLSIDPANGVIQERIYVRAFPESTGISQPQISHNTEGAASIAIATRVEGTEGLMPQDYYNSATASGRTLKTQLHQIISNHYEQSYTSLWQHFEQTDATFAGKVWDIYSDIPCQEPPYEFNFVADQDTGSGGTAEGDVFNREHSMPRSWFGGAVSPMNTDLYHVFPTDKRVNAARENWPYGMVNNPSWTSQNGSKLGTNVAGGTYTSTAFEPIDAYKGDLARAYLYMITRYEDRIEYWTYTEEGNNMLDHNEYPGYKPWVIDMLLQWHHSDPVSHKERMRNDAIYQIQGNRNPFVDMPDYVEKIWGDTTLTAGNLIHNFTLQVYPNPTSGKIHFSYHRDIEEMMLITTDGRIVMQLQPMQKSGYINLEGLQSGVYILRYRSANVNSHHLIQKR